MCNDLNPCTRFSLKAAGDTEVGARLQMRPLFQKQMYAKMKESARTNVEFICWI